MRASEEVQRGVGGIPQFTKLKPSCSSTRLPLMRGKPAAKDTHQEAHMNDTLLLPHRWHARYSTVPCVCGSHVRWEPFGGGGRVSDTGLFCHCERTPAQQRRDTQSPTLRGNSRLFSLHQSKERDNKKPEGKWRSSCYLSVWEPFAAAVYLRHTKEWHFGESILVDDTDLSRMM